MIRNRRKARDVSVTDHVTSLRQLATLITMLPENNAPLSEKSLMYHFRKSMPFEWQTNYDESGREASTVTELTRYVTRQEINAGRKDARPRQRKDSSRQLPMKQRTKESKPASKPARPATGKWCSHHRTTTHSDLSAKEAR
ncbi:hypothetical protein PI125_g22277 [Phytophthora idaei]|nr:hypothetical protein PI125_g22277 [Phytophthora idaei]